MKDYKRLTNRDLVLTLNYNNDFEDDKRRLGYALRLWELENKIERGEIDYVAEWKHRAEVAERNDKLKEKALNNACAMLYAQGVESPFSDEDWHLRQAEKKLQEERKK